MKKFLALLLAAMMVLAFASCDKNDKGDDVDTSDEENTGSVAEKTEFTYEVGAGDTAIITGYTGDDISYGLHEVKVPAEIDDREVVAIGDKAFYGNNSITSVELPDTVKSIGDFAFANCKLLVSVKVPETVTEVGKYAFTNCAKLASFPLPSTVTSIGDGAFYGCTSISTLELPKSLENIGDYAFWGCTGITSVEIPSKVKTLGDQVFWACSKLASVKLTKNIEAIGEFAFGSVQESEDGVVAVVEAPTGSYADWYVTASGYPTK